MRMSSTPPDSDDPEPTPPLAPGDDECCGNGCDPCIFDFYAIERDRYLKALKAWQERQAGRESAPSVGG
jgi:hypothetical protein